MLFNSAAFAVFFPVVTIVYFLLAGRSRWVWLLAASSYFYMAFVPAYILILLFTILVDYAAGLLIEPAEGRRRKMWLILSIIANVGVLAVFKYWNFGVDNLNLLTTPLFGVSLPGLAMVLPIGLSFHTFQSLSYTIEVYYRRQPPERHLGRFALYVLFYPQLVAGPIERPQNLLNQLRITQDFNEHRVMRGLQLMAWGFFKKVVIADRAAVAVNVVFRDPTLFDGAAVAVATVLFAIQIYCDFSGYTDIAIGAAEVMGYKLMKNFASPYFSTSLSEYWKRWHISLSSWFRDYVYTPLALSHFRSGVAWKWHRDTMVTFLLSGLWHGASWNFVIWGGLHGAYLCGSTMTAGLRARWARASGLEALPGLRRVLAWAATFGFVCLTWIFFRATSFSDAVYMVSVLPEAWHGVTSPAALLANFPLTATDWSILVGAIALLFGLEYLQQAWGGLRDRINAQDAVVRYALMGALVFATLGLGVFNESQFIYFQF
jgi:D-alanyl-lipoteichoic acid acyltransferase DltB (MBOAT superfamily)